MTANRQNQQRDEDGVDDDNAEAQTRQQSDMTLLLLLHSRQARTRGLAIHARTSVPLILTIASLRIIQHSPHPIEILTVRSREVDLERTSQERLLVTQILQELGIILRAASNEIHSLAARRTEFDILTAIVETRAILIADQVVQLGDEELVILGHRLGDVDEQALIRGARERAEEVEEILFASRTGGDDVLGLLEVGLQGFDLFLLAADFGVGPAVTAERDEGVSDVGGGFFGKAVVWTGELGAEEGLAATVAADGASACFVFGGEIWA